MSREFTGVLPAGWGRYRSDGEYDPYQDPMFGKRDLIARSQAELDEHIALLREVYFDFPDLEQRVQRARDRAKIE